MNFFKHTFRLCFGVGMLFASAVAVLLTLSVINLTSLTGATAASQHIILGVGACVSAVLILSAGKVLLSLASQPSAA